MNSFSNKRSKITSPHHHLLLIQLHFLFFLMVSISQFPLAIHGCHEHERRALLDFKLSLTSDPSNRLASWQEGSQHENCCHWHGIECSRDSLHVIVIDLRNKEFEEFLNSHDRLLDYLRNYDDSVSYYATGILEYTALTGNKLSSSLFNITHLEYLDLAFNDFHESQIPPQFSHLTKLTYLDLSYSSISASISTQFTNLTSLHYLDLSCEGDSDYTPCLELLSTEWVSGLVNLEVLKLSGVDLSKATSSQKNFPAHISYLSNLRYLDISWCSISNWIFLTHGLHNLSRLSTLKMRVNFDLKSKIPVEMANLTSLSILDLSSCGLLGSIPYLPQLEVLDVHDNYNLSSDLTRMFQHQWPKLQILSISDTNVSGPIPVSISNAPSLVILDAHYCSIQGSLPTSISNLSRLQYLKLSDNHINGDIPISICNLSFLRVLSISNNNITGTIPSCLISKLHNLKKFDVSGNSIGGTVSLISFINELNLTWLDLGSNRLTVDIDQRFHLYSKSQLYHLGLSSCNLKGLFPTFICEFSNSYLDLSENQLEGVVPSYCFSQLLTFASFNLSSNKFHGPPPLPPKIWRATTFYSIFDLSNNEFSGEISIESVNRLSNFSSLNLAGNKLSGPIPFSICPKDPEKSYLHNIDLSNNKLSGIIPPSLGNCTNLISLQLGSNNLTGNVPNELQQLTLYFLQLQENNLDGAPLDFISKHRSLTVLNLANNHFEGRIPAAFGSLQSLRILSLRSNKFNGSIPEELVQLEQLQILDLSVNNLTGSVPRKIGNLTRLRSRPNNDEAAESYSDVVQLQMVVKGILTQFEKLYGYSSGVDLSCNNLEGNIPEEIGLLKGLSTLNLSHNHLSGVIPKSVGNMSGLESLDLSFNRLFGNIPLSLASINSLGRLNLSYNNLSGKIPREQHFDTLSGDGSAYANNTLLCGFYTNNTCEGDQRSNASDGNSPNEGYEDDKEDANEKFLLWAIVSSGVAVGFWGLFFVLLSRKEKWWFPYWKLVDVVAVRVANWLL